jgi:hypothetical protein
VTFDKSQFTLIAVSVGQVRFPQLREAVKIAKRRDSDVVKIKDNNITAPAQAGGKIFGATA